MFRQPPISRNWYFPQQLVNRWHTPEGKELREQIIQELRRQNEAWCKLLADQPGFNELKGQADLRGIDLRNFTFSGIELMFTRLDYACLEGVHISDSLLDCMDVTLASLRGASFSNCRMHVCVGEGACFAEARIVNCDLTVSQLANASFKNAVIEDTNLGSSSLDNVEFAGATLRRTLLSVESYYNTSFDNTLLENVNIGNIMGQDRIISLLNPPGHDFVTPLRRELEAQSQ